MNNDDLAYHRERAAQCRSMAELANSDDVRRRHEELAALHAERAAHIAMPFAAAQASA
jgi:hypothetical protein